MYVAKTKVRTVTDLNPLYLPNHLLQLAVFAWIYFWNVVTWIRYYHKVLLPEKKNAWISTLSPLPGKIAARRWIFFLRKYLTLSLKCWEELWLFRGVTSMITHSTASIFKIVWLLSVRGREYDCMKMWFKIDGEQGYHCGTFIMRRRVS